MYELEPSTNTFVISVMSHMIDILHEERTKLEERVLTMESALAKTRKELLETKKEVNVL